MSTSWVILVILAAIAVYAVALFNRLVKTRQMAEEGWSGIDVQLKRRADLVPNLVETIKGYAAHESALFEETARLRSEVGQLGADDVVLRGQMEGLLSGALGQLLALAEAYPDLKASDGFRDLQASLVKIEDEIQMSRRYYNGAARNLNVMAQSFPSNLIAQIFSFAIREYFEIDAVDRKVPEVSIGD